MVDRCVCCGEYVPEGRQVCWSCENEPVRGRRMTDLESNIFHGWQDLNFWISEETEEIIKAYCDEFYS